MFRIFKKGSSDGNSVTEKECFQTLTTEQLQELAREFHVERRNYLHLYIDCLEKEYLSIDPNSNVTLNPEEKKTIWNSYHHFNGLVQWVEKELEKR